MGKQTLSPSRQRFPDGFLWGAATSSHQVEGNQFNDWSVWERSRRRMADLKRRGLLERHGRENFLSGIACDHYRRFRSDFALAKDLGHNATRFSLEWSRIEPHAGKFDERALKHYRDVVWAARALGLEPFVTLWHWTHPLWFAKRGGWTRSDAPALFARYANRVAEALGDDVTFWLTLNEPEIAVVSYVDGRFPPQHRNPLLYFLVMRNLVRGHRLAYRAIKQRYPKSLVGIAHNMVAFEAARPDPMNLVLRRAADWWVNDWFYDRIRNEQDFLGINYYFHSRINFAFNRNRNEQTSDLGWELYPDGIHTVINRAWRRYGKPIYITEHGCADADDSRRPEYLLRGLESIYDDIQSGIDIRGYLHWALLDNLEWDHGFWPRFGLIAVDYRTQKRTPRPSAYLLRDIAVANALPAPKGR